MHFLQSGMGMVPRPGRKHLEGRSRVRRRWRRGAAVGECRPRMGTVSWPLEPERNLREGTTNQARVVRSRAQLFQIGQKKSLLLDVTVQPAWPQFSSGSFARLREEALSRPRKARDCPGHQRNAESARGPSGLNFVAAEDVVFLPARALGTTQTADQQHRDSGCHHQRQQASARYQPLDQCMHNWTFALLRLLLFRCTPRPARCSAEKWWLLETVPTSVAPQKHGLPCARHQFDCAIIPKWSPVPQTAFLMSWTSRQGVLLRCPRLHLLYRQKTVLTSTGSLST